MPSHLGLTARRTVAALFAAFALLCAQLSAQPERPIASPDPIAISGGAQTAVARLSGSLTLVKAERGPRGGKSSPAHDFLIPPTIGFGLPVSAFAQGASRLAAFTGQAATTPYQARAPPVRASFAHFITF